MISEQILLMKERFYLSEACIKNGSTRTVMALGAMICSAARTRNGIIVYGLEWPESRKLQGWPDESRTSEVIK